jgi:hypothetical protein
LSKEKDVNIAMLRPKQNPKQFLTPNHNPRLREDDKNKALTCIPVQVPWLRFVQPRHGHRLRR